MMLRPSKSRVHAGEIAFPGGKKEEEDKNLIETAIREMEEEIGVSVPTENILGALSPIYIPPSNALVTQLLDFCKVNLLTYQHLTKWKEYWMCPSQI